MFLNCEGNELASGFNLPFKFANQIVKKKLSSCVKTENQITWTLAEEGRTRSKASRQHFRKFSLCFNQILYIKLALKETILFKINKVELLIRET